MKARISTALWIKRGCTDMSLLQAEGQKEGQEPK
jgi:hypothetical protein